MSPQDYEYLLMALDLARMDKRWGFSIMVMKWNYFLGVSLLNNQL